MKRNTPLEEAQAPLKQPATVKRHKTDIKQHEDPTARLQSLPKELRLLIWELLIDDQPVQLDHSRYQDSSAYRPEPPISRVCHLFRADILPIHYARTAFLFNVCGRNNFNKFTRAWKAFRLDPSKFQLIHKFSIFGEAMRGGLVLVTFDFARAEVIDHRWMPHPYSRSYLPRVEHRASSEWHWHYIGQLDRLISAFDNMSAGLNDAQRAEAAAETVRALLSRLFAVTTRVSRRISQRIRQQPWFYPPDGPPHACHCKVLVKAVWPVDGDDAFANAAFTASVSEYWRTITQY